MSDALVVVLAFLIPVAVIGLGVGLWTLGGESFFFTVLISFVIGMVIGIMLGDR